MKNKELSPASPRGLGALTPTKRSMIYAGCHLTTRQESELEAMLAESAKRDVGRGALNNVISFFYSRKNEAIRLTESHTCEQLFAYELELDPDVVGYQTQIPCPGVTRILAGGQKHVSAPHLDYLVFRSSSIELVECKTPDWFYSDRAQRSGWRQDQSGAWRQPLLEDWAAARGIRFRAWAPTNPVAVYLRNHELIYAAGATRPGSTDETIIRGALRHLRQRPLTLDELSQCARGFRLIHAAWLLATRQAFGLIRSTSINHSDRFRLFVHSDQAAEADGLAFRRLIGELTDQPMIDPICLASTTDLKRGRERLERLRSIEAGEAPETRRMIALSKKVAKAVAHGTSPLEACLTSYSMCGNRTSRLLKEQKDAIEEVIRKWWLKGADDTKQSLHNDLSETCDLAGVPTPSASVLGKALKQLDPARLALRTTGMRGYQQVRAVSDPRLRSGVALGYGHTLHIDSSDADLRVAPEGSQNATAVKPRFYIGVDEASSEVMAHAIYFGNPLSDAFAMLLREYVHRHRHLPFVIFIDRGPEQTSGWLKAFCFDQGITLRYSPTAGSRFNSLAETAIKQTNMAVAHRFEGNTRLDAMGRAVDGRYKSRANARTRFVTLVEAMLEYLYSHHSNLPTADGLSPAEKKDELLATFGMVGRPQHYDEGLLIQTSIPSKYAHRGSERTGVRTAYGTYTSDLLARALRAEKVEEVRRDCIDPTLMYVRAGGRWYRAYHSRVLSAAQSSVTEKIWFSADWDERRRLARNRRAEMSRNHDRAMRALRGRSAQQHLIPTEAPEPPEPQAEPYREVVESLHNADSTSSEAFPEE